MGKETRKKEEDPWISAGGRQWENKEKGEEKHLRLSAFIGGQKNRKGSADGKTEETNLRLSVSIGG